jgi:hypothetical protein
MRIQHSDYTFQRIGKIMEKRGKNEEDSHKTHGLNNLLDF